MWPIGVSPCTISGWRQEPKFESTVNVLLQEQNDACREKLRALGLEALNAIEEVLNDNKTKPKDHLTAALKIVELLGIHNSCNTVIGKVDLDTTEQAYLNGKDPQVVQHLKDLEKYLENDFGDIDEKQIN